MINTTKLTISPSDVVIKTFPQYISGMLAEYNGPGVTVTHIPTGIAVSCDSERSQHSNIEIALAKLDSLVDENR